MNFFGRDFYLLLKQIYLFYYDLKILPCVCIVNAFKKEKTCKDYEPSGHHAHIRLCSIYSVSININIRVSSFFFFFNDSK